MRSTLASPKKPYQKPTLRVYGDIKGLTMGNNSPGGQYDGGVGAKIKTT
jgi:hypothetical protein